MAKVIDSKVSSRTISSYYSFWRAIFLGLALGLVYWLLTAIISKNPNLVSSAGDIATILTATVGLVVMINLRMARPIVVAIGAALALWGLSGWVNGLSMAEVIAWEVVLYGLSYSLLSWIVRYSNSTVVLIAVVLVVIILRIAIIL